MVQYSLGFGIAYYSDYFFGNTVGTTVYLEIILHTIQTIYLNNSYAPPTLCCKPKLVQILRLLRHMVTHYKVILIMTFDFIIALYVVSSHLHLNCLFIGGVYMACLT